MARKYAPRRASKRWLEGAPEYIFDVFDNKGATLDRYTVIFGKPFICHVRNDGGIASGPDQYHNTFMQYLAVGEHLGYSEWGELEALDLRGFRYRFKHHRIKWMDLPKYVRRHVIARATID